MQRRMQRRPALRGSLLVPGDKSISHRTVMLGALAEGVTRADNFLPGADCLSTISCFRRMGIEIALSPDGRRVELRGKGLYGLREPGGVLDCGNSGTTARLLSGILAAQPFRSVVTGDESIRRRPMQRIMTPLARMGAVLHSLPGNGCVPLEIRGGNLHGIDYSSPVASAQVKSSILFAGLYASGQTRVWEPSLSRDHSERMLRALGAGVETVTAPDGRAGVTLTPPKALHALPPFTIPSDISSAAYFMAAAVMLPGSELLLRNVGVNPTRDGILELLREMGAEVELVHQSMSGVEPVADIRVRYTPHLRAAELSGAIIPRLIDELPVIAMLMARAEGSSVIRDARELKLKESNRIEVVAEGLRRMGVRCEETEDGMVIEGIGMTGTLRGAEIDTRKDHRIAMSFSVLAMSCPEGESCEILDADCIAISYPDFYADFEKIS